MRRLELDPAPRSGLRLGVSELGAVMQCAGQGRPRFHGREGLCRRRFGVGALRALVRYDDLAAAAARRTALTER